jgi:hypothetical protein
MPALDEALDKENEAAEGLASECDRSDEAVLGFLSTVSTYRFGVLALIHDLTELLSSHRMLEDRDSLLQRLRAARDAVVKCKAQGLDVLNALAATDEFAPSAMFKAGMVGRGTNNAEAARLRRKMFQAINSGDMVMAEMVRVEMGLLTAMAGPREPGDQYRKHAREKGLSKALHAMGEAIDAALEKASSDADDAGTEQQTPEPAASSKGTRKRGSLADGSPADDSDKRQRVGTPADATASENTPAKETGTE